MSRLDVANQDKYQRIFNGEQTRELIENGRVLSDGGHGKLALADGTVNAYAGGFNVRASSGGDNKWGNIFNDKKKKTGGSSSSPSSRSNSSSPRSSSSSSSSNSSSAAKEAEDTSETIDWIEVKIDRLEREIEHFDSILSSTYQSWSARNSALASEISKTTEEIKVQYKQANNAYKRYIAEANKVSLSDHYKKLVQNGAIDIETIKDEKLAENIKNYQEWYEKALDCKYAIDELQESLSGLYETAFENTQTWFEEQMDNIEVLQDLNRYANYGYRSSYKEDTWDILKKDIKLASDEVGQLENKMNDALRAGAIAKYSEAWWSMLTAINEAKLAVFEYQEALLDAIEDHRDVFKEINESQQEYQRNRGSFGGERHYANEEIVHSSNLINQLTEALNDNIRKNGLSFIGSDAYYEQITRLSDAFNDETEAYKNIIELDQDYYERLIKHNDAYYDNAEAIMEGAEAFGEYEDTEKYRNEILKFTEDLGFASKEAERMEADLNAAVASGAIKKGSTEWLEQRIEIEKVRGEAIGYKNDIEEANQKIRELEYEELFDRVIDKMDQFVDKIETINGLIHDEMMYDYDTGKLTETGALALILNNNALDTSIAKLNKYAQERQRIMDDYANGLFGKETFDKLMDDVTSNINSTLGEIDKSRNNILTIIKDQTKAELDVLDKVISKRQEAIQKQREYWEYGKQLDDKNKEIQLLQQQIESLNGVSKYFCPIYFNCWKTLRVMQTTA